MQKVKVHYDNKDNVPVLILLDCGNICNNNLDVEFFNPISNTALTKSLWSDSGHTNLFFNLLASIIS